MTIMSPFVLLSTSFPIFLLLFFSQRNIVFSVLDFRSGWNILYMNLHEPGNHPHRPVLLVPSRIILHREYLWHPSRTGTGSTTDSFLTGVFGTGHLVMAVTSPPGVWPGLSEFQLTCTGSGPETSPGFPTGQWTNRWPDVPGFVVWSSR